MEGIIERLFNLIDCLAMAGTLTKSEEDMLASIEKDYAEIKESTYSIKCPHCETEIQF